MTAKDGTPTDPAGEFVTVEISAPDWAKIKECARRDSRTPQRILHVAIGRYHLSRKL
jgi:hypothetical protein